MRARPLGTVRPCLEELERRLVPAAILSTSTNWSGYAVTAGAGGVSDVAGKWVVPAVTGSGTAYSSAWVGIDGFNSPSVEQIGTDSDVVNGTPQYYAWYEMYPAGSINLPLAIRAGDTISADVSYGAGKFTLSITNTSTGKSYTTTRTAPGVQRSSAEWVMEAPSSGFGVLPLANFGKATFSGAHATVHGKAGAIDAGGSGARLNEIDMVSQFGASEDTTSALTDSGNPTTSGFTVTYTASTNPAPPPTRHHRWWWFGPDQPSSSAGVTLAAAAAGLAGAGTASAAPQTTLPALSPASEATAMVSRAALSAQAPSAVRAASVAGYRLVTADPGDGTIDAPAAPQTAPAQPGTPAVPPSDADQDASPEAAVAAPAGDTPGWACDSYFVQVSREQTAPSDGPPAPPDRATDGAAAPEMTAGLFLALALGGAWRGPAEGTGARRRRPRLPAVPGT